MKKLINIFYSLLVLVVALYGCKEDMEFEFPDQGNDGNINGPTIEVTSEDVVGYKGDTITLSVDVSDLVGVSFVKADYEPWEVSEGEHFESTPASLTHEFKIVIPYSTSFGTHHILLGALNTGELDVTLTTPVEVVRKPGVPQEMYLMGDMAFVGSLGKGWEQKYADRMVENEFGMFEVTVYNATKDGEFIFVENREDGAQMGLDPDDATKVAKGSDTKISISGVGYHTVAINPETMEFEVAEESVTNTPNEKCYIVGSGFEEFPDWTPAASLEMDKNSDNPNEFNAVVTRSADAEGYSKFLIENTGWSTIIAWDTDFVVEDFGDNSYDLEYVDDGVLKGAYYTNDAGELYSIKLDYAISRAVVLPYAVDPSITAPTITITEATTPVVRGSSIALKGSASDDISLSKLIVSCADWNYEEEIDITSNPQGIDLTIAVPIDAPVGVSTLTVKATNGSKLSTTEEVQITVEAQGALDKLYITGDASLAAVIGSGANIAYADKMATNANGFELIVYNSTANGTFRFVTSRDAADAEYYGVSTGNSLTKDGTAITIADVGYHTIAVDQSAGLTYTVETNTPDWTPSFKSDNMKILGQGITGHTDWDLPGAFRVPQSATNEFLFSTDDISFNADTRWVQIFDQTDGADWGGEVAYKWNQEYYLKSPGDNDFTLKVKDGSPDEYDFWSVDAANCSMVIDMYLKKALIIEN